MSRIFISYRREDTAGYNLSLAEPLKKRFGRNQVFMDLDSIKPGVDFREVIQEAVSSCDALIALIGRNWLAVTDDSGEQRLDDPDDFVRLEIKTALDRKNILVIPALVHGATMPRAQDLPPDLRDLAWRNAIDLRDSSFSYDVDRLAETLREELFKKERRLHTPPWQGWFTSLLQGVWRFEAALGLLGIIFLAVTIFVLRAIIFPPSPPPAPPPAISLTSPALGKVVLQDTLASGAPRSLPATSADPRQYLAGFKSGHYDLHGISGASLKNNDVVEPVLVHW